MQATDPRVMKRLIVFLIGAILLTPPTLMVWDYLTPPEADYRVRQGEILLSDGDAEAAQEHFDAALALSPDHPGALMGRAITLMKENPEAAERTFDRLIVALETPDRTDQARRLQATALANRGILKDRLGRHSAALVDYLRALQVDAGAVEGPGVIDKILYGSERHQSSILDRARYLHGEFQKPESERVLSLPEIDQRQRPLER